MSPNNQAGFEAPGDSRATVVTFFEDRAEVVRTRSFTLKKGQQWVTLSGVSPFVDERTVTAKVTGSASISSARVKWHVHEDKALGREEIDRLREEEIAAIRTAVGAARGRERADRRIDQINALYTKWSSEVAKVAPGIRSMDKLRAWREGWTALGVAADGAHKAIGLANEARQRAEDLAMRARARLAIAATSKPRFEASIEVDIEGSEEGEEALVEVTYRVPCALWRPEHLFRLLPAKEGRKNRSVEIVTWATVWHAAGEDWEGARARFSTARPARDATPPLIRDDVLHLRRKSSVERSRVVVEAREQTRELAGIDRGIRAVEEMPGVDDGGEPLTLEAKETLTISSDGQPHRVEIGRRTLEADVDRVLYPEMSGVAHLRATATLSGGPLLAGPLHVARNGSLVGRSKINFVGTGEPFEIGFGPDDGVRARRHVEEQRDTTAIIGTQKIKRKVDVFLSNLSGEKKSLIITERVPVSEIEDLEITLTDAGDFGEPDEDGFLAATVRLSARETRRISFSYEIRAGSNVVLPF